MGKLWMIPIASAVIVLAGCSKSFYGGAAVGAGAAGVAYEANNKRKLKELEDAYRSGRIDRQEYERRRADIEDDSLVY